jgi:hypothetical protein
MAAITPTALDSPGTGETTGYIHVDGPHKAPLADQHNDPGSGGVRILNAKRRAFHFTSIDSLAVATFDFDDLSGGQAPTIVQCAWEPNATTDDMRVTFSGTTITLTGSSATASGTLYVWTNC